MKLYHINMPKKYVRRNIVCQVCFEEDHPTSGENESGVCDIPELYGSSNCNVINTVLLSLPTHVCLLCKERSVFV